MLRAYRTEIRPTDEQKQLIHRTIGVARYVHNFYLAYNKQIYESEKRFVSANEFSKWLNNDYIPNNSEFSWIKEVSSKSTKQSIMNAEKAFKRFFKKQSKFPKFKKKKNNDVKMYFVKTDDKAIIRCERHRIKIPTLGWVRLKEYGYIPTNEIIKSGTVSYKAGRYYVSVLVDYQELTKYNNTKEGIGIDLGVKDFAIVSNGAIYKNINKTQELRKLNKKLKREQRKLSRRYENIKNKKGEATRQNLNKQILVVQKLHQRIANIRDNYHNQIISDLVKLKPNYITIEDLNVSGMMKNKYLSKAIQQQGFYSFVEKLITKAHENNIEIRRVDRFYPSSKICHNCGQVKSDLELSDRVYVCDCGYTEDRDLNAAMNLRDATEYKIA
jgi:putative transposase